MEHEQTIPEQRKEAETSPDSDTRDQLSTSDAAEPDAEVEAAADAVGPRRRRGRTTLLIAGAAALGVLAGTVTGYAIQYDREPTPLPPLAQTVVTPKALAPDATTSNKTINANRWHKTDDDLAKLLIEAPKGAKVVDGAGYESLDWFATNYESPGEGLHHILDDDLRRVVSTSWSEGEDIEVEVRLLQFRDRRTAEYNQRHQTTYRQEEAANAGAAIPGVADGAGHVWVASKAEEKPGYHPLRVGTAEARRGDVVVEIFYYEKRGRNIAEDVLIDLAKRQLERL
ncbi:hypothetical protein [Streptomyces sp. NPDC001717]|uniref:hypothetical protein n=1 Tax=Streptomyces sp. NPDC001717 TaxID=3364604 RepID=UPI00367FB35D